MESEQEEIQRLIARLDELIPADEAWIELVESGGSGGEDGMRGNRSGYLRLGLALMQGGLLPLYGETRFLMIDLDEVVSDDSTAGFSWFELDESPKKPTPIQGRTRSLTDVLLMFGCALIAIGVLYLLYLGVRSIQSGHFL